MRRVALVVLASLLFVPPVAVAHGGDHQLTIVAKESGCPDGRTFCFEVSAGGFSDVGPGDQVRITFRNDGQSVHNVYVTTSAERDPARTDTPSDTAFAKTGDLDEGEAEDLSFAVPGTTDALYLWCDIAGHEQLGMWIEVPLSAGHGGAGSEPVQNGAPAPGFGVLAGLLVLGAFLLRRRS